MASIPEICYIEDSKHHITAFEESKQDAWTQWKI